MSSVDYEALKKRKEGGGRNDGTWKPKAGANRVFILPPESRFLDEPVEFFAREYRAHFFNIEGQQSPYKTLCLGDVKQKCPACATSFAYKESEDPGFKQLSGKIRRADQYLFNMLDLNNLQAGIQVWRSNYTCWNQIMEIGSNPSWGNIVDPASGIVFTVTQLLSGQTKTGRNQYSVVPDPQRMNFMGVLENIPEWRAKLDELDKYVLPPATSDEIRGWLEEMGFPSSRSAGAASSMGSASIVPVGVTPVSAVAPKPAGVPSPVSVPVVASAPMPSVVMPVAVAAPAPVAAPSGVEPARPNPAPVVTVKTGAVSVHYDPGPHYKEKVPASERPDNAPRCFGDYDTAVHRCQACPVLVDCQMKMLGD